MAYRYTLLAKTIVKSEPLFWLQLAGENWIEFCANDTVNKIDSLGLVDILLNDNWDYIVMGMAFNEKDVFIVNAHSDGTFIYDYRPFTPTMLTPQDLADMIRRHPKYKPGMPVKLQACETGGKTFGPQLADILQATVIAPIGLWVGRSTGEEWFENPVTKLKDPSQGYIYIRPKIVVGKPSGRFFDNRSRGHGITLQSAS